MPDTDDKWSMYREPESCNAVASDFKLVCTFNNKTIPNNYKKWQLQCSATWGCPTRCELFSDLITKPIPRSTVPDLQHFYCWYLTLHYTVILTSDLTLIAGSVSTVTWFISGVTHSHARLLVKGTLTDWLLLKITKMTINLKLITGHSWFILIVDKYTDSIKTTQFCKYICHTLLSLFVMNIPLFCL